MFAAGIIVLIIAVMAIFKGIPHRIKTPNDDLKKKISNLEKKGLMNSRIKKVNLIILGIRIIVWKP
ncbi:hypothetical protein SAMN05421676_105141 [Salinibacillus kushneri]|uniref:Uncharacterized protein n=2 Tax=Salinibacillus kushneri TaxID=237682 RepID=A0A1I0EZB2_9BACI|nr:hypothetical protein SAMN05421676_105141 [Salinibacillus kushneri]